MVAEVHDEVVPLLGGVAAVLRGDRPPRLLLGYLVLSRERSEAGGSTKKTRNQPFVSTLHIRRVLSGIRGGRVKQAGGVGAGRGVVARKNKNYLKGAFLGVLWVCPLETTLDATKAVYLLITTLVLYTNTRYVRLPLCLS